MKTKLPFVIFIFLLRGLSTWAQTSADCAGGIVMCEDFYSEQNAPTGFGSIQENVGNCNSGIFGENNSIWYIFSIDNSGFMNFILNPNNPNDDYDWAVINITNGGCAGINNLTSPVVSCNSFGLIGFNGPTGISSANGGVGNNNGPGNLNGPAFNANLNVQAGETYALCVMNWSGSPSGYTLNFGGSTASFYDNQAPTITSVTYNCTNNTLSVSFSENIVPGSVHAEDFLLSGPQGNITATSVSAVAGSQSQFTVQLSQSVSQGGTYTLNITDAMGYLTDACGNEATAPFDIILPDGISFEATSTVACQGVGGTIEVSNITGGTGPFVFALNGAAQPLLTANNLTAGIHTITITDSQGCVGMQTITVPGQNIAVNIPTQPDLSCTLSEFSMTGVTVNPLQNVQFAWSTANGNIVSGDNQSNPTINEPGLYSVTVTNTDNGCTSVGSIQISEDNTGEVNINFGPDAVLCEGETLTLDATSPGAVYTWQDGSTSATYTVTTEGTYSVNAVNGNCTGGDEITVTYIPTLFSTLNVSICEGSTHTLPSGAQVSQAGTYVSNMTMPDTGCLHVITSQVTVLPNASTLLTAAICEGESHVLPNNQVVSLAGDYPVIYVAANGCDSIVNTHLIVRPLPSFSFSWSPLRPYLQDPLVQFSVQSVMESEYHWVISDLGTTSGSAPEFLFPNDRPDFYEVCASATSPFGCTAELCQFVGIYSQMNFWCPNSFTPNSDDRNDVFKPVLNGHRPDDYLFEIYDRWGEKIFETQDPEMGWTGNHTGGNHYVQNDLYFWRVKVQPLGVDNRQVFTGTVMILR